MGGGGGIRKRRKETMYIYIDIMIMCRLKKKNLIEQMCQRQCLIVMHMCIFTKN